MQSNGVVHVIDTVVMPRLIFSVNPFASSRISLKRKTQKTSGEAIPPAPDQGRAADPPLRPFSLSGVHGPDACPKSLRA